MGHFVVEKTIKMMIQEGLPIKDGRVGVLGLTFKEDCPDLRNTRVVDIIRELESYGCRVCVHDPLAHAGEAREYYGVNLCSWEELKDLGAAILAVPHEKYRSMGVSEIAGTLAPGGSIIDVKSMLNLNVVEDARVRYWRL